MGARRLHASAGVTPACGAGFPFLLPHLVHQADDFVEVLVGERGGFGDELMDALLHVIFRDEGG
ncbi:MAG: hypothetical protein NZT92_19220 [Abditibacteriales bacterium]|nr:hypothetical protein [Abditibacteriales bacterium]MDW8367881.1 hypothetical protein [Abditibacteriales bacterium]